MNARHASVVSVAVLASCLLNAQAGSPTTRPAVTGPFSIKPDGSAYDSTGKHVGSLAIPNFNPKVTQADVPTAVPPHAASSKPSWVERWFNGIRYYIVPLG